MNAIRLDMLTDFTCCASEIVRGLDSDVRRKVAISGGGGRPVKDVMGDNFLRWGDGELFRVL